MPNCDFYGTLDDHRQLLNWLFTEGTCRVFELASDFERPLKEFKNAQEVLSQFERTYITGEKWHTVYLQLYVTGASPPFVPRRVQLDPEKCKGATFRYAAEGWGLVQLYLGAITVHGLKDSHSNHNSEKRAIAWAPTFNDTQNVEPWDFKKITNFSSRLNRQIKRFSAAKRGSRAIFPGALKLWEDGITLLPNYDVPVVIHTNV